MNSFYWILLSFSPVIIAWIFVSTQVAVIILVSITIKDFDISHTIITYDIKFFIKIHISYKNLMNSRKYAWILWNISVFYIGIQTSNSSINIKDPLIIQISSELLLAILYQNILITIPINIPNIYIFHLFSSHHEHSHILKLLISILLLEFNSSVLINNENILQSISIIVNIQNFPDTICSIRINCLFNTSVIISIF